MEKLSARRRRRHQLSKCHFNQFHFSGLNWSHMKDLGAFFGPIFVIFRRAPFFKNTPKSVFNDIYNIQVFQDTYSQNGFFPMLFSHPTRPPGRSSARHRSQVIKLVRVPVILSSQVIQLVRFPVFLSSQVIKLVRVPVFLRSQVIKMVRYISRFPGFPSGSESNKK